MEAAIVFLVLVIIFVSRGIRIVPQQSAFVIERLGRCLLYTSPSPRD